MMQKEIPDSDKPHVYFDVSSLFRPKDVSNINIKDEIDAMIEISKFIEEDRIFLIDSLGIHDTIKAKETDAKYREMIKFALEILKKKKHLAASPRYENSKTDGFYWVCFGNEERTKEIHKDLEKLKGLLSKEDYKIIKFVIASAAVNYFITSDRHFFKSSVRKILSKYNKKIYKPDEFLKYFLKYLKPHQDRMISN